MSKCPKMSKVCIHKLMPVEKAVAIPTLPLKPWVVLGMQTKLFAKGNVLIMREGLGEEISDILRRGHIFDLGFPQVLKLLGVVILDINVLGPLVRSIILG